MKFLDNYPIFIDGFPINTSGGGISSWDPIDKPDYIQSGIIKNNGVFILLNDLSQPLDNLIIPVKSGSIIYFNATINEWLLQDQNLQNEINNLINTQGKNRGTFATSNELPSATNGDYAFVIATTSTWIYNNAWIDTETDLRDNFLNKNNNLSELDNKSVARQNLSVYSTGDVDNKLTAKQNITDNTLNTIDKTIVGAINETLTNNPSQTNDVSRYVNPYNGNDALNGEQKRKKKRIISAKNSLAGQSSASIFLDNGTYNEVSTGTATKNGTTTLSSISGVEWDNLIIGQVINGTGITAGTTIAGFNQGTSTITLSQVASGSGSITITIDLIYWNNSANRFSLIGEANGDERCVLLKGIVVGENNGQCAFQNLKFDNLTGICLDFQCSYASPTLTGGNHIINNINIGGNVTNPTAIKYGANYGGTYTMIIRTDLNNKILEFENLPSGQRKIAYLYDASNSPIKAGTGWSIFKTKNCVNITPLTRNNNIFKGEFANGIISNETEYNIIIGLGAVAYGFYLANYTKAGYFVTGDVLLIMSSIPIVQEDYLSAENTCYNLSNGKTYYKIDNKWLPIARDISDLTKENTGFIDLTNNYNENILIDYNSTNRTISLTGTFKFIYQDKTILDINNTTWTSPAHALNPTAPLFLKYDGSNFVWTTTAWAYYEGQLAYLYFDANGYKFGIRETHGLMPWQTHKELHQTNGTYKISGGTISGITTNNTTPANRRPDVSSILVADEDLQSAITSQTNKLYTILNFTGANGDVVFTTDQADIVPLNGTIPYYNQFTGGAWQQTAMSPNQYMSIFQIAVPVISDSQSQKYRYLYLQGQAQGNIASQQALNPQDLNLNNLLNIFTEFVFINRIIIRYLNSNDWTIIQVDTIKGTRNLQTTSASGNYLSSVAVNSNTLVGDGKLENPLNVIGFNNISGQNTIKTESGFINSIFDNGGIPIPQIPSSPFNQINQFYEQNIITKTINDLPTGGSIGLASATIDLYNEFDINQTTAGQTITLPNPTTTNLKKSNYFVKNIGSVAFTILSQSILVGETLEIKWNGSSYEIVSQATSGGHVIKDATTTFTQRSNLQFTGDGVSVTDDNVNDATKITITGGSGDTGIFSLPVSEPIIAGDVVYQDSISGKWKKIVQVVAGNSSEIIAQGSVTSYSEDYSVNAIATGNIPSYKNSYLYGCCQIDSNRVLLVWKSGRKVVKARIKTINGTTETLGPVKELTGLADDYNFILDTPIAFNSSLAVVLIGQSTGDSASTANKRPAQAYALGIQIAGDVIQNLQLSVPVQTWSPLPTYSSSYVQMFFRKYANYLVFFGIMGQTNAAYIETRTVNPDGSLGSRVNSLQVNINYGGQGNDYIRRNFFDITLNGCFIIKDEGGTTTRYGFISPTGIITLSSTVMTNIGDYQSYRTFPHPYDPNKLLYIIGTNSTDTGGVWRVGIVDCTNASPTVAPTLIPNIKIIMADQVGAGAHPNYYDFQMPSANVIAFIYEPYANRGVLSMLTTSISGNTIGDFKFTGTVIAGQLRTITSIAGLDWSKVKVGMSIHGSKSTSTVYTQQDTRVVSFINGVSITVDKDILTATTGIDFNIGTIIDAVANSGDYSWTRRIIALDGKLSMFNYGSDNNFHSSTIQFGNTNSVSPSLAHGIAIETQNTIDQPCNVVLFGKGSYTNNNATYTTGLDYYIQADGTIGSTATDYKIGRALTTTKIELFNMIRTAIITSTNNTEIIGEDALYFYKWTYKSGINAGVDGKIYLRRIEKSTNIFEDFLSIDSSSGKLTMKNRATTPPISLNNEGSIAVIGNKIKVSENGIYWKSVVPEVVNCYLSSQATNTGQGDHIKFDTINGSNSDNIIVDIATAYSNVNGASSIGRITLKAGGTYEIRGFISKILTPASGIVQYAIYNANDGTRLLGSAIGTCVSATNTTDTVAYGGDAEALIITTTDIKIELRIESNVAGLQIPTGSGTALFIKKIS